MSNSFRLVAAGCAASVALALAACSSSTPSDALTGNVATAQAGAAQGVNLYLWRASLDTVSFMPIASADPLGGVIVTDWYSPPETPNERFKANIVILDRQLRSDGVRASLFRQTGGKDGHWSDAGVDPKTVENFENEILARARQLRATAVQVK